MAREYQSGQELIPGYRLSDFLGRGGFGQVWKCTAPGGAEAAMKIIDLAQEEGLREQRALKLVKRIRHANLVPVTACWVRDELGDLMDDVDAPPRDRVRGTLISGSRPAELIILMGLGEKNLLDRLEECRQQGHEGIPAAELLDYLDDAARGIDYLNSPRHDLGSGLVAIQHCDVKPQNIVIVGAAAQVCDFGLARVLTDVRQTRAGMSLAYAAPELIEGNQPSHSTDQYSLAISYVELRTGELPFEKKSSAAGLISAHLNGELDLSRLGVAERNVILRATAVAPDERYPSALAMVRALRQACGLGAMGSDGANLADSGRASGRRKGRSSRREAPRHTLRKYLLGGTLAAALGVLLAASFWTPGRAERVATPRIVARPTSASSVESSSPPAKRSYKRNPIQKPDEGSIDEPSHAVGKGVERIANPSFIATDEAETPMTGSEHVPRPAVNLQPLGRALLRVASKRAEGLLDLGRATLSLGRIDGAAAANGLVDNPRFGGAPNVARIANPSFSATDQPGEAAAASESHPAEQDPDLTARGLAHYEQGDLDAAIDDFSQAIRLDARNAEAYRLRAAAYADRGEYENALSDYEGARANAPVPALAAALDQLRVQVSTADAPLLSPGVPVIKLPQGTLLRVEQAAGDWLLVELDQLGRLPRDRDDQRGWVARSKVEPATTP